MALPEIFNHLSFVSCISGVPLYVVFLRGPPPYISQSHISQNENSYPLFSSTAPIRISFGPGANAILTLALCLHLPFANSVDVSKFTLESNFVSFVVEFLITIWVVRVFLTAATLREMKIRWRFHHIRFLSTVGGYEWGHRLTWFVSYSIRLKNPSTLIHFRLVNWLLNHASRKNQRENKSAWAYY